MIASIRSGASNVSRSILPRNPRSIFSAPASSLMDANRPSSSSFCHRNARASAFSKVGLARVRTTSATSPFGVTTVFRPGRLRIVSGTPNSDARAHAACCNGLVPRSRTKLLSPSTRSRMSAPSRPDLNPLHQQPHDPRLLGREQLAPQRGRGCLTHPGPHPRSGPATLHPAPRARCPTTISGCRSSALIWPTTAVFDLRRRHPPHCLGTGCVTLQHMLRHVVAIQPPPSSRVCGRQRSTIRAKQQPLRQRRRLVAMLVAPCARALLQRGMHLIPKRLGDDRLVLAGDRSGPCARSLQHTSGCAASCRRRPC